MNRGQYLFLYLFISCLIASPLSGGEKPLFTFLQLTDTQIDSMASSSSPPPFLHFNIGGYRQHWQDYSHAREILANTLKLTNSLHPDFTVHTGDITNRGKEEEMEIVRGILSSSTSPWYVLMGDHDYNRNQGKFYYSVFGERNRSFLIKGWQIIVLSIYPQAEDFRFLVKELDEHPNTPTIIFTHRLVYADPFTLWLARRFLKVNLLSPYWRRWRSIVERRGRVIMVVSGHAHSNFIWRKKGIYYVTTSALCEPPHQFRVFEIYPDSINTYLYTSHSWKEVREGKWGKSRVGKLRINK